MNELKAELARVINDPAISIVDAENSNPRPATPPSSLNNDAFHALERAAAKVFPGAPAIPIMQVGATDSAQLRAKGVQAYDIGTMMSAEDLKHIHGNDERLDIASFGKFVEFLYTATQEIAGSK
jgi:acetylornithine deacetylase/succinyl-diaminopimelate desuccinylase-like protein